MAEPHSDYDDTERYETEDPKNPPGALLDPRFDTRASVWAYLGPIVGLCIVVGIALAYWALHDSYPEDGIVAGETVGTAGQTTPGGFDPAPRPGTTQDEIRYRGEVLQLAPLSNVSALQGEPKRQTIGRPVDMRNVEVIRVDNDGTIWIEQNEAKAAVIAPPGAQAVRTGMSIDVTGVVERDGKGGARIRATRVNEHK